MLVRVPHAVEDGCRAKARFQCSCVTEAHGGDDRVSRFRSLAFLIMLTPISEGTSRKVDTRDGSSDDRRAEPEGLCAEFVHEFGAVGGYLPGSQGSAKPRQQRGRG